MKNTKIFLSSPHMGGREEEYIKEAFKTNWIAPLGPNVVGFERETAEFVGAKRTAALSSGTSALHLALRALKVQKGDVVFCSSLTFSASCNPIVYEGATPVFIDSDRNSWNMCPKALEKALEKYSKLGKLPKAIIVVNLYGQSADYDKILPLCNKYNVPVIEDAAESLGATYKDKYTGTIGKLGVYSFNGNKIITTSGGGMLVSDSEEIIEKVKFWATQAREKERHYEHKEIGYNYRMSNILAGVGRGQLQVLEDRIEKKKYIYDAYKKAFSNIQDVEMMPIESYGKPNYWLSVITLKEDSKVKPLDIIVALEKENIESRPVWKPMHMQPVFSQCDFITAEEGSVSVSEDIFNRGVCLPSDTKMKDDDLFRVCHIVKSLWEKL